MSRATQMTEDSNGSSQSLMTSLEVWAEAAGGMKKGNLYGLGSESSIVSRALSVPSHFVADSPQRQNTEDIKALRQEMVAMAEKVNNMQAKINEMQNAGPSSTHPSADEIATVLFAKMSSHYNVFPSSGPQ